MNIIDPYNFCNLESAETVRNNNLSNIDAASGINNSFSIEIKTKYDKATGEYLIDSPVNAFIVFGRDRNAGPSSGTGGTGHTGAAAIDIIAGHGGPKPLYAIKTEVGDSSEVRQETEKDKKLIELSKNFSQDASRLYLTQKAKNIDNYLEIPEMMVSIGNTPYKLENNNGTSAALLLADSVRIKARENLKLVTFHGCTNSLGKANINSGIAIIAGANKAKEDPRYIPQPMVKGTNLMLALEYLSERITQLQNRLTGFLDRQIIINNYLATHRHQSGAAGFPTNGPLSLISDENFKFNLNEIPSIVLSQLDPVYFRKTYLSLTSNLCIFSEFNVNN